MLTIQFTLLMCLILLIILVYFLKFNKRKHVSFGNYIFNKPVVESFSVNTSQSNILSAARDGTPFKIKYTSGSEAPMHLTMIEDNMFKFQPITVGTPVSFYVERKAGSSDIYYLKYGTDSYMKRTDNTMWGIYPIGEHQNVHTSSSPKLEFKIETNQYNQIAFKLEPPINEYFSFHSTTKLIIHSGSTSNSFL